MKTALLQKLRGQPLTVGADDFLTQAGDIW